MIIRDKKKTFAAWEKYANGRITHAEYLRIRDADPDAPTPRKEPLTLADCSIIVTCKDRLEHLRQTIYGHLAQQAGEYIVVDYDCPQQSGEWVGEHFPGSAKIVRPGAVNPGFFNVAHARNCAAKHTSGKLLVFIDADVSPKKGWLLDCLKQFNADEKIKSGIVEPSRKTWSKTGTCLILADTFHQVRGYREFLDCWGFEDIDLYRRLREQGGQFHYSGDWLALIEHDDDLRVKHFPEKNRNTGLQRNKQIVEKSEGMVNPEGYGLMEPLSRGVMTAADSGYFPGLQLLAESLRQTSPTPLRCVDLGLTDEQRQWCDYHGVRLIPSEQVLPATLVEKCKQNTRYVDRKETAHHLWPRPWLAQASPFESTIWIDADAVVLRPLDKLFDQVSEGFVALADEFNPAAAPNDPTLYDLLPVPKVDRTSGVNSGVFGFRAGRDGKFFSYWKDCVREAIDREEVRQKIAWHDQGAMLWAMQRMGWTGKIRDGWRWNCPANGLDYRRVKERRRYAGDDWLERLRDDHPGVAIVHYMARPKLWELRR